MAYDKYLNATDSVIANPTQRIDSFDFHTQYTQSLIDTGKISVLDFGVLNGGTLTLGGASNGSGLQVVNNSGGTQVAGVNSEGVGVYGTASFKMYDSGGTLKAYLGFDPTDGPTPAGLLKLVCVDGDGLDLVSNDYLALEAGGDFTILSTAIGIGHENVSSSRTSIQNIYGDIINIGYDSGADAGIADIVEVNAATFSHNGTVKNAIVPTSEGYKALYTNESPGVWFMDFGTMRQKGFWPWNKELDVDPLFREVAVEPYHTINTNTKNVVQVWGKRKGFEDKRFESMTEKQFKQNTLFWSKAHE